MVKKLKKPWPTIAVMTQIYDKHLWGGKDFDFYSGTGSHDPKIINPYVTAVIDFLKSFKLPITVCDLGCGDFNVGKNLAPFTKNYIAIDIVEILIDRNKAIFKADNLKFYCLDITKDELPKGDCVILRQVLQHLSNVEILKITKKLTAYKYIILTEHMPIGNFEPNKDIISGQGIRLKLNSGVDLLANPFNLKVKKVYTLNQHVLDHHKGQLVTSVYEVY